METRNRERQWQIIPPILLLLILLILDYEFPLQRALSLSSISYNEGWNTFQTWSVLTHRGLYLSPPGTAPVNYPPVSFWLQAAAAQALGLSKDGLLWLGRSFSGLGLALDAALIALIVSRVTAMRFAAPFGALLFLVGVNVFAPSYIFSDDPQLFAHVFALAGVLVLLPTLTVVSRAPRWGALVGSAVLLAIASMNKLNLIGYPIAIALWLLFRNRRQWLCWSLAYVATLGAIGWVAFRVEGPFVLGHLTMPRSYGIGEALKLSLQFLSTFQLPVLFLLARSFSKRASAAERLFMLLFACSFVTGAGFAGGAGVNVNIFFEALSALCLFVPIALANLEVAGAVRRALPTVLCLGLALTGLQKGYDDLRIEGPRLASREADFRNDVEYLRKTPGPVVCEDLLLCFYSGHALVYDTYAMKELVLKGRVPERVVRESLARKRYGLIQVDAFANELILPERRFRFTEGVMKALLGHYELTRRSGWRAFFVPRRSGGETVGDAAAGAALHDESLIPERREVTRHRAG